MSDKKTNEVQGRNIKNELKQSTKVIQYQGENEMKNSESNSVSNTGRATNKENIQNNGQQAVNQKELSKKYLRKIVLISLILMAIILVIFLSIYLPINQKKKDKNKLVNADEVEENELIEESKGDSSEESNKNDNKNEEIDNKPIIIQNPDAITKEEAMKVFTPTFNIASKEDTLTQLSSKSKKTYITTSDGVESSYSIFSNAKYDIYTLNSTSSGEDKDFYSTKYTTAITINSLCTKLSSSSSEDECELKKYLDLNIKNKNNLRGLDDESYEKIKEVILPICLIEHTDTNIILSVTCPETLSKNLKNDIILAFQSIKPDSANSIILTENSAGATTEEKDGKIYINSFTNDCEDYDGDPDKKMTCKLTRNIVTDKEGNLITSEKISKSETVIDEKNKYSNSLEYTFEDISKQATEEFNEENYKANLNVVFGLTKNLMKKESYISDGNFEEILDFIMKDEDENSQSNIRNLKEENVDSSGISEGNLFQKTIYNINLTLNLQNDIGLGKSESAKAITNFQTGNISQELSHNEANTKLEEIMNKFITLSKSGNKIASELFEKLNDPLLELRDIINNEIGELNELLAFKELGAIFDSTYAVNKLENLPSKFIAAAENLYKGLNGLNIDVPYLIDDMKEIFKEDISTFLLKSHELLYNIFKNLTETTNSLSSKKSKIAEISSFYLNHTDTSYFEIIQQAKEILETYYINEKNLIEPIVNEVINKVEESVLFVDLKNIQESLAEISERIDNGDLIIPLASDEDYKNIIKNIYNANNKVNEIISNVQTKFREAIGLQSNGYFETQKEINNNKQSYSQISERAMNISYTLDNNELIDKIFDNIMIYFRDQFIVILNYMDKSKKEKFPLKEDVLSTSSFPSTYINQIDNNLKTERTTIKNFIKEENREYLDSINHKIISANTENANILEEIINNIQNQLSDLNLDNLDEKYNQILNNTIYNINTLIIENNNLATQYLTNVKNSKSTHRTAKLVNNYAVYMNSLSQMKSYIQNNLKSVLVSKYKTIITQIRSNLQTVKSSEIIQKYINQLPFAEKHLKIIDNLYIKLEKFISDSLFNNKYLPSINNFISTTYNTLNKIEEDLKTLYNSQSSLTYSSSTSYDYYKLESYSYRCCKFKFGRCWKHKTCWGTHYVGYTVGGSKNHENLKSIDFDQYTLNFDIFYSSLYSKFNNYIISYNNALLQLNIPFEEIKENIKNKNNNNNNNYLNNLYNQIDTIINEKLGDNLLNSVYNYYKNELTQKMPAELNSILDQWKNTYDEVYEYVNTNISNFKASFYEFSLYGSIYLAAYSNKICNDYFNSVVNKIKNDFNYTIKYYYNTILSKVNKTYSYILNNIPTNEKPFDEILNLRTSQIKESYNNLLNKILTSKNTILQKQYQLSTLKVSEGNFFNINSFINTNIENINQQLGMKIVQFSSLNNEYSKEDSEELIVAKFYLENAQIGKHIKETYDQVNKATFIDFQNDVFQQLIDDIWEIEQDELIKNINISLTNSNENLLNNFELEKENYINILRNKIYSEYEYNSKEDLEKDINNIYANGLKSLNINSKTIILGYLNEVLIKIKSHISNEANRLSNELTSYSTNYNVIQKRLNDYKTSIYNQFYNAILSIVNEFYSNVTQKFYQDYLEKYLDEYQENANKKDFKGYSFLNISFNLKEIVNKNLEILINEHKELAKNQINFLNQKNIQQLSQLFIFSDIENTINTEINNCYIQILEPVLEKVAIYNSGDEQVSDYDFSNEIIQDINKIIKQKIEQTTQIINEMKGNNYLENNYIIPRDFSKVQIEELNQIQNLFNKFASTFSSQELKNFRNVVLENVKNNFKLFINNFVPSFGKDFFDRIVNFNEIEKIKSLYNNLKYSLVVSSAYYSSLCQVKLTSISTQLPEDIKLKILTLNNIDETIKSKNNQIIVNLNSKFGQFLEDTKNYIIEKYINEMKSDSSIGLNFEKNIKTIIEQTLDGYRSNFEDEYLNMMNNIIKNPFIDQYTKIIQKETNELTYYIENRKEEIKEDLNKLFTLNSDNILLDIECKLNSTLKAIQLYNYHFNSSFKISSEVQQYLENYGKDIIYPKYEDIKSILDKYTIDLIMDNLIKNSEEFEKEYSIEIFKNKSETIIKNLSFYFDDMNISLKKYGLSDDEYKKNLENEISNYKRIRRLEDTDDEKILYNQQAADYQLDKTIQELKNSSINIKEFLSSLNLFNNFDDKISKYIRDINYQNTASENTIQKNKDYYDELSFKLYELYTLSMKYYNKVNSTYYELKEFIMNKINLINNLIEKCSNITYEIIANKYVEYKDEFNPVNKEFKEEKDSIVIDTYEETIGNSLSYFVKSKVEKFQVDNAFTLDILMTGELKKTKVVGKVVNKNKPKTFEINFYSKTGNSCGKIGRIINAEFNNISLSSDIDFDSGLNSATIHSNFNIEEYNIKIKYYEAVEHSSFIIIGEIYFPIPSFCTEKALETPENEKELEVIPLKEVDDTTKYTY